MNNRIIGSLLLLMAAAAGSYIYCARKRQHRALLWAVASALGEMESGIRWQRTPLPALLEALRDRKSCGLWFQRVLDMLKSEIALQNAWENAFIHFPDKEAGEILRRISWSGDSQRLVGVLTCAREEIEQLYRHRCEQDRCSCRVTCTATLCGAGLLIILLL